MFSGGVGVAAEDPEILRSGVFRESGRWSRTKGIYEANRFAFLFAPLHSNCTPLRGARGVPLFFQVSRYSPNQHLRSLND